LTLPPRPRARAATPRAQSDDHAEAGAAGTAAAVTAPFHLAVPVHDLSAARAFYGELLGFPEGRSAATWVDYNMSVPRRPQTRDRRTPKPHGWQYILQRPCMESVWHGRAHGGVA